MSAPAPRESSEVHLRGHRTFGGGKGTLGNGEGGEGKAGRGGEGGKGRGGLNMGAGVRQITSIQAAVMAREAVAAPCHPSLGLLLSADPSTRSTRVKTSLIACALQTVALFNPISFHLRSLKLRAPVVLGPSVKAPLNSAFGLMMLVVLFRPSPHL